jgi:oleate hydratase
MNSEASTGEPRRAYLIGGGIGSLAAAAFMIRDGGIDGAHITILESSAQCGGALDAAGSAGTGYTMRGGRMLTTDNYECTWDLFKSIPSLSDAGRSVYEETLEFNEKHVSHAKARLVGRNAAILPVSSMGFSMQDRIELLKLSRAAETVLSGTCITDWLSPPFFDTAFWTMWATTFAFQPWHSALEFKRYLHRFMLEFSRIETLAGVKRTIYNQNDSLVRPLCRWLERQGVRMLTGCTVTALDHVYEGDCFVVTALHSTGKRGTETLAVSSRDLVFVQVGSMTDASSLGSTSAAPKLLGKSDAKSWRLWEALADGRPQFGNPAAFNDNIAESAWESFTVTLPQPAFFQKMKEFSGNDAGTGGLVTFSCSNWLMSVVLPHQPHFIDQPDGVQVFWGYALFPDRVGDFVPKAMQDCSGAEILEELRGHLRFDPETLLGAICIPCRMPYITSMFLRRETADRPQPVPIDTRNIALVSQFVEIPGDVVFTVEYSVRAAQMAVYSLLGLDLPIPPITPHDKSLHTQVEAVIKAFR